MRGGRDNAVTTYNANPEKHAKDRSGARGHWGVVTVGEVTFSEGKKGSSAVEINWKSGAPTRVWELFVDASRERKVPREQKMATRSARETAKYPGQLFIKHGKGRLGKKQGKSAKKYKKRGRISATERRKV